MTLTLVTVAATGAWATNRALRSRVRIPQPLDCDAADLPSKVPRDVRRNARLVRKYLDLMQQGIGAGEITSWWRPQGCNERVGGAARSRHLVGAGIDLRISDEQTRRLVATLYELGGGRIRASAWGDYVREAIGTDRNVGLSIYPSGNLHLDLGCPDDAQVCDPRRADWVNVDPRWLR